MADHIKTGQQGEEIAANYLQSIGYQVLETNWRFSRAEVDIIAKDGEILVFVEVKTRSSDYFGHPEESIDERKIALLSDAASVYMERIHHEWEIRFDIISIIFHTKDDFRLKHFKDSFFPGMF